MDRDDTTVPSTQSLEIIRRQLDSVIQRNNELLFVMRQAKLVMELSADYIRAIKSKDFKESDVRPMERMVERISEQLRG